MTRKELEHVLSMLSKIRPENPFVEEAKLSVQRDIERRKQQSKAMQDANRNDFEGW